MVDRIPHARLRREMHDDGRAVLRKNAVDKRFVRDRAADEHMSDRRRSCRLLDQRQTVLLQRRVVIVVHVIERNDRAAIQLLQQTKHKIRADKAGGTGDEDRFAVEANRCFAHMSIPSEQIACIDFCFHIIQNGIVTIGNDAATDLLESAKVVYDLTAKKGAAVLERRLIDHDLRAFCLDALHNALDRALTKIVGVCLHRQAIDAYDHVSLSILLCFGEGFAVAVGPGDFQNAICDKVLAGAVALHDGLNQVFRHVAVIRQQLFRVLGQTVTAVAERWVVVIVAHARVEAHALDDRCGV